MEPSFWICVQTNTSKLIVNMYAFLVCKFVSDIGSSKSSFIVLNIANSTFIIRPSS